MAFLVILTGALTQSVTDKVVDVLPCWTPKLNAEACVPAEPRLEIAVFEMESDDADWPEWFRLEFANTGGKALESVNCHFDVRAEPNANIRLKEAYGPDGIEASLLDEIEPNRFVVSSNPELKEPGVKTYMVWVEKILATETFTVDIGIRLPSEFGNIHKFVGWCTPKNAPIKGFSWPNLP